MTEIERIKNQMSLAFEGDAWCGQSLKESLAGVTAAQAMARPIPEAHTIWEILLHVAAWKGAVCRRLTGEKVEKPAEGDYPPITDASEAAWQLALGNLEKKHRQLWEMVKDLNVSQLDEMIRKGGQVSIYETLHGMIQHDLYHAAQIVLLKRARI